MESAIKPVWCLLEAEGEQGGELFLWLSSFSWFLLSFSGSLSSFIRNLFFQLFLLLVCSFRVFGCLDVGRLLSLSLYRQTVFLSSRILVLFV